MFTDTNNKQKKATQPRMMPPPGLSPNLILTLCDLDLLHLGCRDTVGTYHNTSMPGLVKICHEISRWEGFLWPILACVTLTFDPITFKVDRFIYLPRGPITCSLPRWRHQNNYVMSRTALQIFAMTVAKTPSKYDKISAQQMCSPGGSTKTVFDLCGTGRGQPCTRPRNTRPTMH